MFGVHKTGYTYGILRAISLEIRPDHMLFFLFNLRRNPAVPRVFGIHLEEMLSPKNLLKKALCLVLCIVFCIFCFEWCVLWILYCV